MGPKPIALAVLALLLSPPAAADAIARSQACVDLMKRSNPRSPIRAGLSENRCPLPDTAPAYRETATLPWLGSGEDCTRPLPASPGPEAAKCGTGQMLIDGLGNGIVRIPLAGGRCLHVAPLVLSDRTAGFACNALEVRPACLIAVRQERGRTVVRLAASRTARAETADIIIPDELERHRPLLARLRGGRLVALLPSEHSFGSETRRSLAYVRHKVEHVLAGCRASAACRAEAEQHATKHVQEVLRRVWNPRPLVPESERTRDREALLSEIRRADLGPMTAEKRSFARLIIENEIAGASPYQMLDAVLRNSSLSWGAHQIDIGANEGPEVPLFWDTLKAWRRAPGTGDYPHLRRMDAQRACFAQPIRAYFTDHLALLYQSLPDMSRGFRSEIGRRAYDTRFKQWLDEEVPRAARLTGLFQVSAFARIYYLDQRNQRGTTAEQLRTFGQSLTEASLTTCAAVTAAEERLVKIIRDATEPGEHYDVDRRVANLRRHIRAELGPGEGRRCE